MSTTLLLIDCQNDFCHPEGALFVPGAEEDMARLADFIQQNQGAIDEIVFSMDSHAVNDISHPMFWKNPDGKHPDPLTQITYEEIEQGQWEAQFMPDRSHAYVRKLEEQGEYPHLIWPEHCLTGSWGFAMHDTLMKAIIDWTRQGNYYRVVQKGQYPFSEHFGIFNAQVPNPAHPETLFNQELAEHLKQHDQVLLAGEARSHCVGTTLKQILAQDQELTQRLVLLEDAMSNVPDMGHLAAPIFEEAEKRGVPNKKTQSVFE